MDFTKLLFTTLGLVCITLWCFIGFKAVLLFVSSFSLMTYLHISFTTLCNAFVSRDLIPEYDTFWKMFFLIASCMGFTVYFSI